MAKVLVCDDEFMNRKVASKILTQENFEVIEATNGQEAIDILKKDVVDLILMDLMMPVLNGFEATKIIKENDEWANIPLIIISALSDKSDIIKALKLGANEYMTKPFEVFDFKLRVTNAIKLGSYQNMLKEHKKVLEQEVDKKTKELQEALKEVQQSEKDTITILAKAAEFRDNETSMHTIRVGEISALLSSKLGFSDEDIELMRLAAPMHDMGKVGISDNILLKPGKLEDDEFETMKTHASIGHTILTQKDTPLLQLAAQIGITHHEKYDGSGYPNKLSGDDIPLCGAIVAVVDVFDALMSERPYKKAFSLEKTLDIIKSDSGKHFNPKVVDIFLQHIDEIVQIRETLKDV